MLDYLIHYHNPDYRFIKLGKCTYKVKDNTLLCVFLFAEEIKDRLAALKPLLEKHVTQQINENKELADVKIVFEYRKSYTDELLLKMEIKKFLIHEFSILTLDLGEDDIHVAASPQGFTVNIYLHAQNIEYIKHSKAFTGLVDRLHDENFCNFDFYLNAKAVSETDEARALERLEQYMENSLPADSGVKADKVLKVKGIEYWLGKPVKERPIKIEFLKISSDEQVIAGEIKFLTRREYTKGNEQKPYWTFVLDDGKSRANCVFFPTDKTYAKFEKLTDSTVICAVGIYSERNGRTGFRVNGVSFCELN